MTLLPKKTMYVPRYGNSEQIAGATSPLNPDSQAREVVVDTDKSTLVVMNANAAGGVAMAREDLGNVDPATGRDQLGAEPAGTAEAAMVAHHAEADPHPVYSVRIGKARRGSVSVAEMDAPDDGLTSASAAIQAAINSGAKRVQFPGGTYLITAALQPVSGQRWEGAGAGRTRLIWAGANGAANRSMVKSTGDLADWSLAGLSLIGNRAYQTTPSPDGQDLAALHLRGGHTTGIVIEHCEFREFGDTSNTGGAGILLGAVAGANKQILDILIRDNLFENIANVPGVYIAAAVGVHSRMADIRVRGNVFRIGTAAAQNSIYILGNSGLRADGVDIDHNHIEATQITDAGIELNWAQAFAVKGNKVLVSGAGSIEGILVRSGCRGGVISDNLLRHLDAGVNRAGIELVRFGVGETMENIIIAGNSLHGFLNRGISLGSGCDGIIVSDNTISGIDAAAKVGEALRLSNAQNCTLRGNRVRHALYGAALYSTCDHVDLAGNVFAASGDAAASIITGGAVNTPATNIAIRDNTVIDPVAATPNFVSPSFAAATGNRVECNHLPSGMAPVNPSYLDKVEAVVLPAATAGRIVPVLQYQFDQGSLPMSDGTGFTIGGNLDASAPACALGDFVEVACSVSLQGATVTPYVAAAGQVRIRVQNETGGDVTVAAATWYVAIKKRI